jgi:hypothetical protein
VARGGRKPSLNGAGGCKPLPGLQATPGLALGEMGGGEGTERGNATTYRDWRQRGSREGSQMEVEGENGSKGRVLSRESINAHTS